MTDSKPSSLSPFVPYPSPNDNAPNVANDQNRRQLWGRSLSRPLSKTQQSTHDQVLSQYSYTPKDVDFLNYEEKILEIGFGDGEHLISLHKRFPRAGILGCERFINGVAKVCAYITSQSADNIRLFPDDVHLLIPQLPKASFDAIYVLFPDPWPKKRHRKRRLLKKDFMHTCHTLLKPNGVLYMASDIEDYRKQIMEEMGHLKQCFVYRATQNAPLTKYCRKALREGRSSYIISFKNI